MPKCPMQEVILEEKENKMPVFKIPVTWEVCGVMNLVGDNVEEAIEKAENGDYPYPSVVDDIEGSLKVNLQMIEYLNPGVKVSEEEEFSPVRFL